MKMKEIKDDVQFANEINSDYQSRIENSPGTSIFGNPTKSEKDYFDEVSGRFHSTSTSDSEDSFQIVFSDTPKLRRTSDCDSEDSFIVFEDFPDSCYTSNDVFGNSSDSEDDNSDSCDVSESSCSNTTLKVASVFCKRNCNQTEDSLYVEEGEDEVDCAFEVKSDSVTSSNLQIEDSNSVLLIEKQKKLLQRGLQGKRVQFSQEPPKVHVMYVWTFAARQARSGHWERFVVDRERFKRRIANVDIAVSWVLKPQHRSQVIFQRFTPWWDAQKRKELAENKEKEAQGKLRRDEEELRAKETEIQEEIESTADKEEKITAVDENKESGQLSH